MSSKTREGKQPGWNWPEISYPEGRHPEKDLFSDETVENLVKVAIGQKQFDRKEELRDALRSLASEYCEVIHVTPLGIGPFVPNMGRDERRDWLLQHVLEPVQTLRDALQNDKRHMYSDWPDDIIGPQPNRKKILSDLKNLQRWVGDLVLNIQDRMDEKSHIATEFNIELGLKITVIFRKFFPEQNVSRGTYFEDYGRHSPYLHFLRCCYQEITGQDEKLDAVVQQIVKFNL